MCSEIRFLLRIEYVLAGCTGAFQKQGGMPETRQEQLWKHICWRFPVHALGETCTVFDEASDAQVEHSQFKQPGPQIWENLRFKHIIM